MLYVSWTVRVCVKTNVPQPCERVSAVRHWMECTPLHSARTKVLCLVKYSASIRTDHLQLNHPKWTCMTSEQPLVVLSLQGVKRCSPITGCEEFYYPPWKRAVFRWLVSLPICLLCLCFVFFAMLLCLQLQVWA